MDLEADALPTEPPRPPSTLIVCVSCTHASLGAPSVRASPSAWWEPRALKVSFFLSVAGQNVALHAAPADRAFSFTFLV